MSTSSDFQTKAAQNVAAAREGLAEQSRTREANGFLCDLLMFDDKIRRGEMATALGGLQLALSLGGLPSVAYSGETADDVREALRAYGQWLLLVAERAR